MKRKCKELKLIARENILGNYSTLAVAILITNLIVSLVTYPFSILYGINPSISTLIIMYIATFLISMASSILICGQYRIHLAIAHGKHTGVSDMFYTVTHRPDRYILAYLLFTALTILAILPLFLSYGLILISPILALILLLPLCALTYFLIFLVLLRYQLVYFFLLDDETLGIIDAFKLCRQKMHGHKGRLLYITFSFLPMYLLTFLSFGLATFWVQPYQIQTLTVLYLEISGQLDVVEEQKKAPAQTPEPTVFNQYV